MLHKQLYTKTIHLNPETIAEYGVVFGMEIDLPADDTSPLDGVLMLKGVDIKKFIPENAIISTMSVCSKYFFLYDPKGIRSVIPVNFDPYITTILGEYVGLSPFQTLNVLIKGPNKEQIPDESKLYSVLKPYAIDFKLGETGVGVKPFDYEHLLHIDLVINYTLDES